MEDTGNQGPAADRRVTVLLWGTFDLGKPRMRLIIAALEAGGVDVVRWHCDVWTGVEDKSGLRGPLAKVRVALAYVWAILRLWVSHPWCPRHDVVLIGYMGQVDVLAFRPIAWLTGKPVVWDAFLSLYDTVVLDRRMLREGGLAARVLRWFERRSARAADVVVLDTAAHAARFHRLLGLDGARAASVFVGAEMDAFPPRPAAPVGEPPTILFYGQFIPLHGIATIVEAARRAGTQGLGWRWRMIGTGQEAPRIRALLDRDPVPNLDWVEWVPYDRLSDEIAAADVCLGIFGDSGKAASVIPNKAFQVFASARPLLTRDSPAMRELTPEGAPGLALVPPADPDAILAGIADLLASPAPAGSRALHGALRDRFSPLALGSAWRGVLEDAIAGRRRGRRTR